VDRVLPHVIALCRNYVTLPQYQLIDGDAGHVTGVCPACPDVVTVERPDIGGGESTVILRYDN
jgi:hypothetical protein